ncbi:hypothetical protein F5B21DRAFT_238410 [Xylaria acuta]|nr:hypothetical protein F5B21DRAFT_238410 [Xylaria acuta]
MEREKEVGHNTFELAPTSLMNASSQVLQPPQEQDAHDSHTLRRSSRRMAYSKHKSQKSTAPEPAITTPPIRGKKELLREQEAASRARRKQLIDAGVEKLTAEWMEKAGGDHNKAAGFWFEREEQKRRQPWPGLQEGEAFVEKMKKDILDPLQIQRQMEEQEDAEENATVRTRFLPRRIRERRLAGSKTAAAAPSADSKRQAGPAEQARHMLETQQLPTSTALDLTAPTKTAVNPKPPLAASGKQLAPSTALQSAEMLSTPLTNTSPPPPRPEKQDLPTNSRKRKRNQTEAKKLLSDLGEEWAVSVTDTGHRPCVKKLRQQNGSE